MITKVPPLCFSAACLRECVLVREHSLHSFPPPLCCCWLIVTAPESAACLRYSHTHLPLLVSAQHLEPETSSVAPTCSAAPGPELKMLAINTSVHHRGRDCWLFCWLHYCLLSLNRRKKKQKKKKMANILCLQLFLFGFHYFTPTY